MVDSLSLQSAALVGSSVRQVPINALTGKVDFAAETQSACLYTAPENFLSPMASSIAIALGGEG